MLEPIVGSRSSEQVFIFLVARENGYATEIAKFFDADLYAIQRQLERLENAEVLVSKKVGRTRVYQFNPRYPFLKELKALLTKVLSYYPDEIQEKLLMNRRRHRKKDKPL
jgi:predicted ArsR family transcriptional regulator